MLCRFGLHVAWSPQTQHWAGWSLGYWSMSFPVPNLMCCLSTSCHACTGILYYSVLIDTLFSPYVPILKFFPPLLPFSPSFSFPELSVLMNTNHLYLPLTTSSATKIPANGLWEPSTAWLNRECNCLLTVFHVDFKVMPPIPIFGEELLTLSCCSPGVAAIAFSSCYPLWKWGGWVEINKILKGSMWDFFADSEYLLNRRHFMRESKCYCEKVRAWITELLYSIPNIKNSDPFLSDLCSSPMLKEMEIGLFLGLLCCLGFVNILEKHSMLPGSAATHWNAFLYAWFMQLFCQ